MNQKLSQKASRRIIVADDAPITLYRPSHPAAQPAMARISVAKVDTILALAVLLCLVSLSFLGPDFAFLVSFALAAIPPMVCAWVVYRAFGHFSTAAVTGVLIAVLMAYFDTVTPFVTTAQQYLLSLSHVAGYLAGLILAVMIGVGLRRSE